MILKAFSYLMVGVFACGFAATLVGAGKVLLTL